MATSRFWKREHDGAIDLVLTAVSLVASTGQSTITVSFPCTCTATTTGPITSTATITSTTPPAEQTVTVFLERSAGRQVVVSRQAYPYSCSYSCACSDPALDDATHHVLRSTLDAQRATRRRSS